MEHRAWSGSAAKGRLGARWRRFDHLLRSSFEEDGAFANGLYSPVRPEEPECRGRPNRTQDVVAITRGNLLRLPQLSGAGARHGEAARVARVGCVPAQIGRISASAVPQAQPAADRPVAVASTVVSSSRPGIETSLRQS